MKGGREGIDTDAPAFGGREGIDTDAPAFGGFVYFFKKFIYNYYFHFSEIIFTFFLFSFVGLFSSKTSVPVVFQISN